MNDAVEPGPETGFRHACTREDFPVDEVVKNTGNAEPFNNDAIGHALCAPPGSRSQWLRVFSTRVTGTITSGGWSWRLLVMANSAIHQETTDPGPLLGVEREQSGSAGRVMGLQPLTIGEVACGNLSVDKAPSWLIEFKIRPRLAVDAERLVDALAQMASEDMRFGYSKGAESGELIARVFDEQHIW